FITQDSVNMVYEALSTKGKTYLFNMNYKKENKITRQMNLLITNKQIGYIEKINIAEGLEKIKIQSQNPYHEVFSEVEKVAYQLIKKLNLSSAK
ncbi:mitochondrial fission ELM1 family protein, partial [Gammaproteobacteria bacterium]|nr:mitochondrial fission ELM1 family protein [Gammaproteobacteria bacterium]